MAGRCCQRFDDGLYDGGRDLFDPGLLCVCGYAFDLAVVEEEIFSLVPAVSVKSSVYASCLLWRPLSCYGCWKAAHLTGEFWSNTSEYGRLFLTGFGSLPVWDGLKDKQFFAFCMGFVIPAVYVLTMMIVGALLYLREMDEPQMFIVYLCVYGLGLYHYFIYRSGVTSYYVVCLPFVFVICFWIQQILRPLRGQLRRIILSVMVVLTFGALVTGYLFTVYPNLLNLARLDFSKEIAFYKKNFILNRMQP